MDQRGEVWKTIIVMIPLLAATLIAVSRIMDARHHPFDVITGSLLGVFTAWASYRQYFPSLFEPWKKGRAYPIRSWATGPRAPTKIPIDIDEGVIPLRDEAAGSEQLYAPARQTNPGESFPLTPQQRQRQQHFAASDGPVYRGQRHRDHDGEYSVSSSEDESRVFEPHHLAVENDHQPYDTSYHSPARTPSPGHLESGASGSRRLAGEI